MHVSNIFYCSSTTRFRIFYTNLKSPGKDFKNNYNNSNKDLFNVWCKYTHWKYKTDIVEYKYIHKRINKSKYKKHKNKKDTTNTVSHVII